MPLVKGEGVGRTLGGWTWALGLDNHPPCSSVGRVGPWSWGRPGTTGQLAVGAGVCQGPATTWRVVFGLAHRP